MDLFCSFKKLSFPKELLPRAEEIIKLIDSLDRKAINVAFVGTFKSGKSSLINALLDIKLLPTRTTTATSVITRLFYSDKPKACVIKRHSSGKLITEAINIEDISSYILLQEKAIKASVNTSIKEVWLEIPHSMLKLQINLVDTPGLDDDNKLTAVTLSEINNIDLAVIVFSASKFMSLKEKEFVSVANERLGGNLVFAVNRMDDIDETEAIKRRAANKLSAYGNQIIGFNNIVYTIAKEGEPEIEEFKTLMAKLSMAVYRKNIAYVSRMSIIKYELYSFLAETDDYMAKLRSESEDIKRKSSEILLKKRLELSSSIKDIRQKLIVYKNNCLSYLEGTFLSNYRKRMEELKQKPNWQAAFQEDSKYRTIIYMDVFFSNMKDQLEIYLKGLSIEMASVNCESLISSITFPSAKFEKPSVSDFVAFPTISMMKLIGRLAGGNEAEKQCVDNAVSIMSYNIKPIIKNKVNDIFSEIEAGLRKYEKNAVLKSGYEEEIEKYDNLMSKLDTIIKTSREHIIRIDNEIAVVEKIND